MVDGAVRLYDAQASCRLFKFSLHWQPESREDDSGSYAEAQGAHVYHKDIFQQEGTQVLLRHQIFEVDPVPPSFAESLSQPVLITQAGSICIFFLLIQFFYIIDQG